MCKRERDVYVVHVTMKHIWSPSWTNKGFVDLSFIWLIGWGASHPAQLHGWIWEKFGQTYGPVIMWCPRETPLGSTHWELEKHHEAHVKISASLGMWEHDEDLLWNQKSIKMHPHTPSLRKEDKWCPFGSMFFRLFGCIKLIFLEMIITISSINKYIGICVHLWN